MQSVRKWAARMKKEKRARFLKRLKEFDDISNPRTFRTMSLTYSKKYAL